MRFVLFFAPGACSRVPLIALEEIGEPFETRLIRFKKGDHRSAEYLALNPAGKVPTLVVDTAALTQNVAILTFLANSFPDAALLPFSGDTLTDARLASQLSWFSSDLHPLVTRIRLPQFFCDVPGGPQRVRELAEMTMRWQLAPLEARLAAQPWLLGAAWSVLDAYLYWVWFRITGAGFSREKFPNIMQHAERMESRPAVKRMLAREAQAEAELQAHGLAMTFDEMPSGPKV
ncbi:MAG TPA: glutathione S-transferase family protein [Steroidobacteraceae bacterium]|nr:glutathione S-transferase family protein [Steroidobacteraceae bacterium]